MSAAFRPAGNQNGTSSRTCRAFFLLAVLLVASCATTPQGKQYQSIAACDATAKAGVRAFGVLYQQHKAEDPALWSDRYDKAQAAYVSYQAIAVAAVDAAKAGGETQIILAAVNEALAQLTGLLATFGVK